MVCFCSYFSVLLFKQLVSTTVRVCCCIWMYGSLCVSVCMYIYTFVSVKKQSDIYHLCLYEVHVLFLLGLFLTYDVCIYTGILCVFVCVCVRKTYITYIWHIAIAFYSDWILFRIYHVYDDDDDVDDDALEKMMPFGMFSMDAVCVCMYVRQNVQRKNLILLLKDPIQLNDISCIYVCILHTYRIRVSVLQF